MSDLMHNFHFIRPAYLYLLPILALVFASLYWQQHNSEAWRKHIQKNFAAILGSHQTNKQNAYLFYVLASLMLINLALAGPSWNKVEQPNLNDQSATAILWDMSPSMTAEDIKPSRLLRSRYKIKDLLTQKKSGLTALIAYSALEKDGLNIPIVPVGLNYFRSHRWRGRAVVEYGAPIYIDPSTLNDYKAGGAEKRKVCNGLLDRIQDSMRSVIVSTPDYDSLQLIHTARRLYQRRGLRTKEKQDMARRFAEGYKMLTLTTEGDPPEA